MLIYFSVYPVYVNKCKYKCQAWLVMQDGCKSLYKFKKVTISFHFTAHFKTNVVFRSCLLNNLPAIHDLNIYFFSLSLKNNIPYLNWDVLVEMNGGKTMYSLLHVHAYTYFHNILIWVIPIPTFVAKMFKYILFSSIKFTFIFPTESKITIF